jgi:predicted ATPase
VGSDPTTASGSPLWHPDSTIANTIKTSNNRFIVKLLHVSHPSSAITDQDTQSSCSKSPSAISPVSWRKKSHNNSNLAKPCCSPVGLRERGDLVKNDVGLWEASSLLDWDILPARVEAVIADRINRLPPRCQSALTVASVEGESFTAEVIAHVQNTSEQETLSCLSGDLSRRHYLVTAQSRQQLGSQHFSRYRFQHFLIQHYLYSNLDSVERASLHEAVADTLEQFYGAQEADLAAIFGQLAWHYQEAGVLEKAIDYCRRAGDRAWKLSAAEEAVSFYKEGLAALQKLPVSPERKQQELTLLMGLAVPLHALRGFAAEEVQATYDRAYTLSRQVGETTQLFFTRSFLGSYYMTSARYHKSLDLGQQNFKLGQNFQDELKIALSRLIMAANYSQLGEFKLCREHLDKLLAFYDPRQHHALFMHYGIDPGVNALVWEALVLWIQGYPDQAEQESQEAINLAILLEHPFSQTTALEVGAGIMHILARRFQAAGDNLKESLEIADRQKFGLFQVEGRFYEGFLLVAGGRINEGLEQMQHSLAAWRATGMRIMHSVMLGLLAQALSRAGRVAEGLKIVEEAFSWVEERDERIYEAELYHVKGNLLQRIGAETTAVESAYRQAIAIAQRQGARSWELRAAISLAKLYKTQDRLLEAESILSEVFEWFTEGFDTPDLQDASKLLTALKMGQDHLYNSHSI